MSAPTIKIPHKIRSGDTISLYIGSVGWATVSTGNNCISVNTSTTPGHTSVPGNALFTIEKQNVGGDNAVHYGDSIKLTSAGGSDMVIKGGEEAFYAPVSGGVRPWVRFIKQNDRDNTDPIHYGDPFIISDTFSQTLFGYVTNSQGSSCFGAFSDLLWVQQHSTYENHYPNSLYAYDSVGNVPSDTVPKPCTKDSDCGGSFVCKNKKCASAAHAPAPSTDHGGDKPSGTVTFTTQQIMVIVAVIGGLFVLLLLGQSGGGGDSTTPALPAGVEKIVYVKK